MTLPVDDAVALLERKILHDVIEPFDFNNPPVPPKEICDELARVLDKYTAIGVAANQLGLPYRVFAIATKPKVFCFNPIVTASTDEMSVADEGCLSFPGLLVKIKRPKGVRVRFQDMNGEWQVDHYTELLARCYQHELDHLNGIDITQIATKFHLEQAKRKKKKFDRRMKNR